MENITHPQNRFQLWLLAIRPKTIPASFAPVIVALGLALGQAGVRPQILLNAVICLLCAALLQIGVNLANDYFDGINNIDSEERKGPIRVTQSGLISPQKVRAGMLLCFAFTALLAIYLTFVGGWPIALLAILSILAALAYSGGPYPIASHALGEIFVFLFFGLVAVGGTCYILLGHLNLPVFWAACPPGLLIVNILIINNLRDIETDQKAGKKTLSVHIGRKKTILLYRALLLFSYGSLLIFPLAGWSTFLALLPVLTAPQGLKLSARIGRERDQQLNTLLAATAKFSLIFSILFAAGLAIQL